MEVYQILIFYYDVNMLGENINAMKKNTDNEVSLEGNAEESKHLFVPHCQNAGQYLDINVGNKSLKQWQEFNSSDVPGG
jgi:uncharacterized protein YxeA